MLSTKVEEEGAKYKQLERVVIGDDEDKFFRSEFNCLLEKGKS